MAGASTRLELRLTDQELERLDQVRGDVPRARWVKRAMEQRLDGGEQARLLKEIVDSRRPQAEDPAVRELAEHQRRANQLRQERAKQAETTLDQVAAPQATVHGRKIFKCPNECTDWRPFSGMARCPRCGSDVVPA